MFLRGLNPQIRRYLASQRFHTMREVADAALSQEIEIAAAQKGKETATRAAAKGQEKNKGKRPNAAMAPPARNNTMGSVRQALVSK